MKFTFNWLKEHLDTTAHLKEITEALINIGVEVENIINYQYLFKDFSVAHIIATNPHPNADRLKVCEVKTKDGILQIVCGATNAKADIKVIYAPLNTYIPGSKITLKPTNIRGEKSEGMLLSFSELSLDGLDEGIIEVNKDFSVGELAAKAIGRDDILIEVKITPNRGDLLGVRGIARDLAAFGIGTLKPLKYKKVTFAQDIPSLTNDKFSLSLELNPNISTKFALCELFALNNKAKLPENISNYLEIIGIKPNNTVVALASFIMFDVNQPLYFYDKATLNNLNFRVDLSKSEHSFTGLDNKEYFLQTNTPIITINNKIEAIAGILGGIQSACSFDTTEVVLECGSFNKTKIALAKRALNLNTDAAYRFERSTNEAEIEQILEYSIALVLGVCGGKAKYPLIMQTQEITPLVIEFNLNYLRELSGIEFSLDKVINIFLGLGFGVEQINIENLRIEIPKFRKDIDSKQCLVEEVIRIYGVNNLPLAPIPYHEQTEKIFTDFYERTLLAKRALATQGFLEVINLSFINKNLAKIYSLYNEEIELSNPLSEEFSIMRSSLIPSLVNNIATNNNKGYFNLKFFEIADVYNNTTQNSSGEETVAAFVMSGKKLTKHWENTDIFYTIFNAKSELFILIQHLCFNPDNLTISTNNLPKYYHSTKSASLSLGRDNIIGYFGEIHPFLKHKLNLKENIIMAELLLKQLPISKAKNNYLKPVAVISDLMPLVRDFAFLVKQTLPATEIIKIAKAVDKKLIKNIKIFDVFSGRDIPEGMKSIAISVAIEPFDKTLTDIEIQELSNKIIQHITKHCDAILRSS